MEIIWAERLDLTTLGKQGEARIYASHVRISDVSQKAREMIRAISDTSWIKRLDTVSQVSFNARAQPTISKLVNEIFSGIDDKVTAEFGEYLISDTAQCFLNVSHSHTKVPLAELLKEKVSGNPGFDFHTETASNLIAFGEAKYSGAQSPYINALNQIKRFVELKKDESELVILQNFVSPAAVNNFLANRKVYVAAFSVNASTPQNIFNNLFNSTQFDFFLNHEEFYIVGIEIENTVNN